MHGPDERSELIRAVTKRGEAVSVAAARLGVALQVTSIWSDRVYLDMSLLANHHAAAA